jgi:oxalate decarboxylase/phosphoglucose isomerase-like protein (cupin superfamily)
VVPASYGTFRKLLCRETTGDERFTLGERIVDPGMEAAALEGNDSEAVHVLTGRGLLRVWPEYVPRDRPIEILLQPGMEVVLTQDLKHIVQNQGTEPLVALVTQCHCDFPAYPHHYPLPMEPGAGNSLHQHDNRVEAMYVISGLGGSAIADPENKTVQEYTVRPGGVSYSPMYVYHRQYNAGESETCYWIHSMVVFTHRGSRMPQLHIRQHNPDGKAPRWERSAGL